MARIVLIGNCQIEAMLGFYRQFAAASRQQDITYVRSYESITPAARVAIEAADIVVEQVQDFAPKADIAGIGTAARRIGVPVVHGGFLWPFAGQPHPHNPSRPFRDGGPYGSETSDGYLNRLIKKGVAPAEALATYLQLDVNAMVSLDRLLEISLDKQRMRDELTGFAIADLIGEHFRSEPLFRTPYHPNVRIALALASQLFAKLEVDPADTRRMQRVTRITPFPKEELPVHPQVARHLGLSWATEDRRYQFHNEGSFTFAEFAERYLACAWNEAIDEGMEAGRTGDLQLALDRLTAGIAQSPQSAAAHSALAHVLEHLGRLDNALVAARAALAIEPDTAFYRLQHGLLLDRAGDWTRGEREVRVAAALAPFDPHCASLLANRLSRDGAHDEAAAVARLGLVNAPLAASLHRELAHALRQQGDIDGAIAAFRRTTDLQPDDEWAWDQLAGLLDGQGSQDAAIEALARATQILPRSVALRAQHAYLLGAAGQGAAAEAAWGALMQGAAGADDAFGRVILWAERAGRLDDALLAAQSALRASPHSPALRRSLVQTLERLGRLEDALAATFMPRPPTHDPAPADRLPAGDAADTTDVVLLITRGDLLLRLGRLADSEAAFRAAVAVSPGSAHAYGQLGYVLSELGRHDEAVAVRRRAVECDSGNPHRHGQLGHVLLRAGRFGQAVEALRQAVALGPELASWRIDLSEALNRAGLLGEAIATARRAVALDPGSVGCHALLAGLLVNAGELAAATEAYRAVLAIDPGQEHASRQLQRVHDMLGASARAAPRMAADEVFTIEPAPLVAAGQLTATMARNTG